MGSVSNKFALWISIGRIASMLVVFAMPLILTRFLTKEEYGVFSQFFTLYSALYIIFGFGLSTNLFYYYPTANKNNQERYVSNTFFLMLVMGVFSILILSLPVLQNALLSDGKLYDYRLLVVLCVALAVPMNIIAPVYTVRKDKMGAMILPPFIAILRVGTIVLCAILFSDLLYIFVGLLIYQTIIFLLSLFYSLRLKNFRIDKEKIKEQLRYSIPIGFTVVLLQLSHYLDKIICISYIPPNEYAIYSVAFLSIPFINQIYDSLCQVNVMNMTTSYQENNMPKVVILYRDFVTKTLSFSTPIILVVALYAEEIIGFLYPSSYNSAAPYFRIYTLTFMFAMFGAGTILRATGKTKYSTISFALSFLFSFPATYFLIKLYGINGAIIGAVINLILPRFIQLIFEIKVTDSSLIQLIPWRNLTAIIIISIGFLIPLLILKFIHPFSIWFIMGLSSIYVVVSYSIMLKQNVFVVNKDSFQKILKKIKK